MKDECQCFETDHEGYKSLGKEFSPHLILSTKYISENELVCRHLVLTTSDFAYPIDRDTSKSFAAGSKRESSPHHRRRIRFGNFGRGPCDSRIRDLVYAN